MSSVNLPTSLTSEESENILTEHFACWATLSELQEFPVHKTFHKLQSTNVSMGTVMCGGDVVAEKQNSDDDRWERYTTCQQWSEMLDTWLRCQIPCSNLSGPSSMRWNVHEARWVTKFSSLMSIDGATEHVTTKTLNYRNVCIQTSIDDCKKG